MPFSLEYMRVQFRAALQVFNCAWPPVSPTQQVLWILERNFSVSKMHPAACPTQEKRTQSIPPKSLR